MTRELLYVSPLFPPNPKVGALRPLKFARHLGRYGWRPVILAARPPVGEGGGALERAVPREVEVVPGYGGRRPRASARTPGAGAAPRKAPPPLLRWLADPDVFPIAAELPGIPAAVRAGLRLVRDRPGIEAVMVNADPYGALLVGAAIARRAGLPLVQDLRDPWSVCALRRARRPGLAQRWVELLERRAFAGASAIVLNTETARRDYVAAYPDLPPERFHCIRNHHDRALNWLDAAAPAGPLAGGGRVSLLFLGHFRRHVEGEGLLAVLQLLARWGYADRVRLVVTGDLPEQTRQAAERRGVADMLLDHRFVPLTETGPVMEAADVLVALGHRTDQRIMAKIYDYATTRRPVLVMADNPELEQLCAQVGMRCFGLDDAEGAASWLTGRWASGRPPDVDRDGAALSSEVATARLAAILDQVREEGRPGA